MNFVSVSTVITKLLFVEPKLASENTLTTISLLGGFSLAP